MTIQRKDEVIDNIMNLLVELTENATSAVVPIQQNKPVEMLTIKEYCNEVKGLSEHTVRQLVAQDKVKYIRTGEGNRGIILVNKADLIAYFQK